LTGWFSAVGGLLLGLSALLPWLGDLVGSQLGYRVPLALVWDLEAAESWLSVGLVAAALGIVVIATAFLRRAWPVRQVAGLLGLAVAVGVAVQIARFTTAAGVAVIDSVNGLGPGFYLALAGALIALLGPLARPKVARPQRAGESVEVPAASVPRVTSAAVVPAESAPSPRPVPSAEVKRPEMAEVTGPPLTESEAVPAEASATQENPDDEQEDEGGSPPPS